MIYPTMSELYSIVKKQRTKNLLKDKICNNCKYRGDGAGRPCPRGEIITCCQWAKDERILFQGGKGNCKWADGTESRWKWYTVDDPER